MSDERAKMSEAEEKAIGSQAGKLDLSEVDELTKEAELQLLATDPSVNAEVVGPDWKEKIADSIRKTDLDSTE